VTEASPPPFSNLLVVEASPGLEAALEELLTAFTLHCRSEVGCLRYDCFQSFENPARFMLQWEWRDEVSWERHLGSEALRKFFERGAEVWIGGPSVEVNYREISRAE